MKERLQILLRLPFLFALSTLILNDHWLKQAHPSWFTGKLSDFSGLFVFVVFLFVILGQRVQAIKNLQVLHFLVASIFVVWKLAPVEVFTNWLSVISGLPMPSRIKDATDLAALVMLLVSYRWLMPSLMSSSIRLRPLYARKVLTLMVLLISGWSIMATSLPVHSYEIRPETGISTNLQLAAILMVVEETMIENGFGVYGREKVDSTTFRFNFTWTTDESTTGKGKESKFFWFPSSKAPKNQTFRGTLMLSKDTSTRYWSFQVSLTNHSFKYDKERLDEAIGKLLYLKLRERLNE